MPTFLASKVDISPTGDDAWHDVDLSAYIPVGATGVLVRFVNVDASAVNACVRKKGSTDDATMALYTGETSHHLCGVSDGRIIEAIRTNTNVTIYLLAYFGSEAVFLTNRVNKSLSAAAEWQDVDISSDLNPGDSAIAALFQINIILNYDWGLRKKGSTDDRKKASASLCMAIVGLDGSNVFQAYVEHLNATPGLIGYLKSGASFHANGIDRSLSSANSYIDLTALPAGAKAGVYETTGTLLGQKYGLRKNGSTDDPLDGQLYHRIEIVECDENGIVEGQISSTNVDFWETGYFDSEAVIVPIGAATIARSPMWGRF